MKTFERIRLLVGDVLNLGSRAEKLDRSTGLLGNLPEFDSIAVVAIVTAIEEQFGFTVDDDEVSAEMFETVGSLSAFVDAKLLKRDAEL